MIIRVSFLIVKMWSNLNVHLGEMEKEDVIYTVEYYLAVKRLKFCHLQQHE